MNLMAMKIKQLINSLLLIVSVMKLLHFSVAFLHEDYNVEMWRRCENSIFNNGSTFQHNLNHVLDSLVGNVSSSGFYTSSVDDGQNSNSKVYGLVQCRGDLGSSDCKDCAATAKAKLVQDCYNTSGLIELNGCFLRYDSYNFYDDNSYSNLHTYICNQGNTDNAGIANDATVRLSNTSNKAVESPKLFAADSMDDIGSPSYKIYNIAQCTRDMSRDSCSACLAYGLSRLLVNGTGCKLRTLGARFLSSNCQLRFDTFPFFDVSILSPVPAPPPSSGGKRSNVLWITLGAVATVVGSIALISLCNWNFVSIKKRWERIFRGEKMFIRGEKTFIQGEKMQNGKGTVF